MRPVAPIVAAAAVVMTSFIATPTQAAPITYDYTGSFFTFCGFGCPDHAPVDPRGVDYIIASLSFAAPLAPNLTFADDVLSALTGWTMTDALGSFFYASANGDVLNGLPSDGIPPLKLSTNSSGGIVDYVMAVDAVSQAVILSPPFPCPASECGVDVDIAAFVAVNLALGDSLEWDAASSVPGQWTNPAAVPEPATLALTGLGLAGIVTRFRRRRSRSDS